MVCSFLRIKTSMLMHLQRWSLLDGLRNDTACACFFYIFSAAVRLRYSWQVHSCYGGKEDDLSYTFLSFCTGCIHHGSISQAAHSRIHPQLWTGLFYNVLQIRRRSADLALLIQINYSGNGSFPVSGNASACSRYGLFRCPCCLSDNAVHVQGIPGGRFHTYKRLHHGRGPVSPDSLQRPCPLFHSYLLLSRGNCGEDEFISEEAVNVIA